jgi:hypothetical protein
LMSLQAGSQHILILGLKEHTENCCDGLNPFACCSWTVVLWQVQEVEGYILCPIISSGR